MASIFGIDFDLISVVLDLLQLLGVVRKSADGQLKVETKAVRQIFPGFRGWGKNDEALFATAWSRINEQARLHICNLLKTLPTNDDRAVFLLVVATIPKINDQVRLLLAFSHMNETDFRTAVETMRMMNVEGSIPEQIRRILLAGFEKTREGFNFAREQLAVRWPVVQAHLQQLDRAAERLGNQIAVQTVDLLEHPIGETGYFAKARARNESHERAGFFARLFGLR